MRNWNPLLGHNHFQSLFCCEPTYEELKQKKEAQFLKFHEMLRAYLWGIETSDLTGLWLLKSRLRAYLWGIETLLRPIAWLFFGLVASLPMRNWNFYLHRLSLLHTELRAYLWGIETSLGLKKALFCDSLRAYLWGIETTKKAIKTFLNSSVASLPMRNWNFSFLTFSMHFFLSCEPTYEELKHDKTILMDSMKF